MDIVKGVRDRRRFRCDYWNIIMRMTSRVEFVKSRVRGSGMWIDSLSSPNEDMSTLIARVIGCDVILPPFISR